MGGNGFLNVLVWFTVYATNFFQISDVDRESRWSLSGLIDALSGHSEQNGSKEAADVRGSCQSNMASSRWSIDSRHDGSMMSNCPSLTNAVADQV